jgi:hypothetical protein
MKKHKINPRKGSLVILRPHIIRWNSSVDAIIGKIEEKKYLPHDRKTRFSFNVFHNRVYLLINKDNKYHIKREYARQNADGWFNYDIIHSHDFAVGRDEILSFLKRIGYKELSKELSAFPNILRGLEERIEKQENDLRSDLSAMSAAL